MKAVERIVKAAGSILREGYASSQHYSEKERGHLLSDFDTKADEYLRSHIAKEFPLDSVYSEEGAASQGESNARWIIDPIDGTTCFVFGEPYFSISVAREIDGTIVDAHVYNPISKEYYFSNAELSRSYLNGKEIRVSSTATVYEALVAFGFSANIEAIRRYYSEWQTVFDYCKKGIGWICPALSICNVARGRIDLFVDHGCSMEGQAAASLILKNAGGTMWDYGERLYHHESKGGVFSNGSLDVLNHYVKQD